MEEEGSEEGKGCMEGRRRMEIEGGRDRSIDTLLYDSTNHGHSPAVSCRIWTLESLRTHGAGRLVADREAASDTGYLQGG